jgi:uncharacterized phage protein (TIGR02220 family)
MNDGTGYTGYVKLHRSLLNWQWHDDAVMLSVFLHCLILANWDTKQWHGQNVARGSFITSTVKLSSVTGLSRQTVSKCIKRLCQTGELDVKSTPHYMVITVKNYDLYQDENAGLPVNLPVNEPANFLTGVITGVNVPVNGAVNLVNSKVNTTKEYKEVKKKEDIYSVISYLNDKTHSSFRATSEKTKRLIQARFNEGFTVEDCKKVIDNKTAEWFGTDMQKYLRPETLFGTKFESYLNQKVNAMPSWYTAEPVRQAEQNPATAEEVEQTRALLMKGKVN